jgi:biopolymer transport protein ExbD
MKFRNTDHREEIPLQMTPMIDIVFQLMVFFVFTFKITLPEGDFNIRMPSAQQSTASTPSESPLLKVRLQANAEGELAAVQLGDVSFQGNAPFYQLQSQIRGLIGDAAGPGPSDQEVEIDADFNLKYRYAMNAITAVTGYVDDNGQQHKLVERVRFSPLTTPAE